MLGVLFVVLFDVMFDGISSVCVCGVCVCACVQFTLWLVVCESVGYMLIFGCILYMMCFLFGQVPGLLTL